MSWLIAHIPLAFAVLGVVALYLFAVYVVVKLTARVFFGIREWLADPDRPA